MKPTPSNVAASVLARLKNEAAKNLEPFNPLLARYVGFRLLYRLSMSPHRNQFLIKGATMFLFWTGSVHRPTRDLDLLSLSQSDMEELRNLFAAICKLECPEDGVVFDPDSVTSELIREQLAYGGSRVKLVGYLGTARIALQIDVGLGDAVTPGPVEVIIPGIVSAVPEARVHGYPVESAIAEKFHAMVVLGLNNGRMKDYFDVAYLADTISIDLDTLRQAVEATFRRRKTDLPADEPICLRKEFRTNEAVIARWRAFVRKNSITTPYGDLEYIQSKLRGVAPASHRPLRLGPALAMAITTEPEWSGLLGFCLLFPLQLRPIVRHSSANLQSGWSVVADDIAMNQSNLFARFRKDRPHRDVAPLTPLAKLENERTLR